MEGEMRDAAGTTFDARFELRLKLGDGMTACVYAAVDKLTGALLACKLSEREAHRGTWERMKRLLRHESDLLRSIGPHPNIVQQQGYFVGPSRTAILLDIMQGGDCQQLLQRYGALPEPWVRGMVWQLHSALAHVHSLGVLHRDVKLENLLCDTRSHPPAVKLCDFGHSIATIHAADDRAFFGTPGYAAPEVVSGPVWTCAADTWAVGVVMYALLSNSLPFEGKGGKRPADFSSRMWRKVSLEAKLLLQSLLASDAYARGTLHTFAHDPWLQLSLHDLDTPGGMRHAQSMTSMASIAQPTHSLSHAASWNTGLDALDRHQPSADELLHVLPAATQPIGFDPGMPPPQPPMPLFVHATPSTQQILEGHEQQAAREQQAMLEQQAAREQKARLLLQQQQQQQHLAATRLPAMVAMPSCPEGNTQWCQPIAVRRAEDDDGASAREGDVPHAHLADALYPLSWARLHSEQG